MYTLLFKDIYAFSFGNMKISLQTFIFLIYKGENKQNFL